MRGGVGQQHAAHLFSYPRGLACRSGWFVAKLETVSPNDGPRAGDVVLEKRDFYEKVTDVNTSFLFFPLLGSLFFRFGCHACCSPPCFYTHFL
jgi:hypothetical protein